MEKFQECREEAKKRLRMADHLLNVTHKLVQDPKILLTALENLYYAFEKGMDSLMEHEKLFKNISAMPETFEARLEIFNSEVVPRYKIEESHVEVMKELRESLAMHEESQVEFPRGDKFVIAGEEYELETLTPDSMKSHVEKAKDFIERVEEVVSENERIFEGRAGRAEKG